MDNGERIKLKFAKHRNRTLYPGSLSNDQQNYSIFSDYQEATMLFSRISTDLNFKLPKFALPTFEEDSDNDSKFYFDPFHNLKQLMLKILLGKDISQSELDHLTRLESDLLICFCKKKRFHNFENITLTATYFQSVRENPSHKSKEENLKFVFKKAFKFLKQNILDRFPVQILEILKPLLRSLERSSQIEYTFVAFYFQAQAIALGVPLENFFQPSIKRNFRVINEGSTPKSINKGYLQAIKRSRLFIDHFTQYVSRQLLSESKMLLISKTEEMISKWEEVYIENGSGFLKRKIAKQFLKQSKTKLPWSMSEVEFSIEQALGLIQ